MSSSSMSPALYGSTPMAEKPRGPASLGKRRLNPMGVNLAFLGPWLLFTAVIAVRSLTTRVTSPVFSWLVVLGAGAFVVAIFVLAGRAVIRQGLDGALREPLWYVFVALTSLLAFVAALSLAEKSWNNYGRLYYSLSHLNDYSEVNPSTMHGAQLMDAGSVKFVDSAAINEKLGMAFRNEATYCVAPITTGGASQNSYDFWAVGLDCCSGSGNFECGAYSNKLAHHGMRWVHEAQTDFYRLAVQQSQALNHIRVDYPLFFRWVSDPVAEQEGWLAGARKMLLLCVGGFFFLQLMLVACALIFFAKLGAM